jgi:hypothetical protein
MGAVFGDDQRLRFGQIERLARGVTIGRYLAQGRTAPRADFGKMIDRGIGCFRPAQRLAGMTFLSAGLLA